MLSLVTEVLPKETYLRAKRDLKVGVIVIGDALVVEPLFKLVIEVTVRLALSLFSCAMSKMLIVFAPSGV